MIQSINFWINSNYLLFTEIVHFSISILIGILIYKYYHRSYRIFLFVLLGGFFIDVDHLLDYFFCYGGGIDINLSNFFGGKSFEQCQKAYVLFHGWEYAVLLLALFGVINKKYIKFKTFILALSLSMLGHLAIDVATNEAYFSGYSITNRIIHNFDLNILCEHAE